MSRVTVVKVEWCFDYEWWWIVAIFERIGRSSRLLIRGEDLSPRIGSRKVHREMRQYWSHEIIFLWFVCDFFQIVRQWNNRLFIGIKYLKQRVHHSLSMYKFWRKISEINRWPPCPLVVAQEGGFSPTCLPRVRSKHGKNQPFCQFFFLFLPFPKTHLAPSIPLHKFFWRCHCSFPHTKQHVSKQVITHFTGVCRIPY